MKMFWWKHFIVLWNQPAVMRNGFHYQCWMVASLSSIATSALFKFSGEGFHLLFECQNTNQAVRQVWRKEHLILETNRGAVAAEQCCVGTLLWCLLTPLLCCHLCARLYIKADKTICSYWRTEPSSFYDVNSEMFSFQLGGVMQSYRIVGNFF